MKIHSIPVRLARAYLIESASGLVLVDAGACRSEQRVLRKMDELGRNDLRLIYITHAHLDHYSSAAGLRRLTGAPVVVHRADGDAMARGETPLGVARGRGRLIRKLFPLVEPYLKPEPVEADRLLEDGDSIRESGLDARVIHTPGHTPGSSCLLVEGRVAFVGDLLSTTVWPHVQRYYAVDWSLIPRTLIRVQEAGPEWVYTGHGRHPMNGNQLQRLGPDIR